MRRPAAGAGSCSSCGGGSSYLQTAQNLGNDYDLNLSHLVGPRSQHWLGSFGPGVVGEMDYRVELMYGVLGVANEHHLAIFDADTGGVFLYDNIEQGNGASFSGDSINLYQDSVTLLKPDGSPADMTSEDFSGHTVELKRRDGKRIELELVNVASPASPRYVGRVKKITELPNHETTFTYQLGIELDQLKIETITYPKGISAKVNYHDQVVGGSFPISKLEFTGLDSEKINYLYDYATTLKDTYRHVGDLTGGPIANLEKVASYSIGTSNNAQGETSFTVDNKLSYSPAARNTVHASADYQQFGGNIVNQFAGITKGRSDGAGQRYMWVTSDDSEPGIRNYLVESRGKLMKWKWGHSLRYIKQWQKTGPGQYSYDDAGVETVYAHNPETTFELSRLMKNPNVVDHTGYLREYTYDSMSNPMSVTYTHENPDGTTFTTTEVRTYDANNQLTSFKDRDGYTKTYTREPETSNLLRESLGQTDKVYTYYGPNEPHAGQLKTEGVAAAGGTPTSAQQTVYYYDSEDRLERVSVPIPNGQDERPEIIYNWADPEGNKGTLLQSVTDQRGHTTSFLRDAKGRIISTTYHDGSSEQTLYKDDVAPREMLTKDRSGLVNKALYDAAGRMFESIQGYGNDTSLVDGQVDTVNPAYLQNKTAYTFGDTPNHFRETSPSLVSRNGQKTTYHYDYRGRRHKTVRTPRQDVARTTENIYQNNLLFVTRETFDNGDDSFVSNTYRGYSADRQTVRIVKQRGVLLGDADGNGVVDFADITAFISMLQSGGYSLAADINQDLVIDFMDLPLFIGALTSGGVSLDFADNDAVMAAVRIAPDETIRPHEITDAVRDGRENIVSMIDEYGTETLSVYDARGRNVRTIRANGTDLALETQSLYDNRGRMWRSIDAAEIETDYTFDDADNIKSMTVGPDVDGGLTTQYEYDPDGVQSKITSPSGAVSETKRVDCCGRSRGVRDGLGNGRITNMDYEGRTVHTATVEDFVSHTDFHNPIDEKTLGETTTRYYGNGQVQFRTVWTSALTESLNTVPGVGLVAPIAGIDGVDGNDGVTTQYLYDTHIGDGLGLDSVSGGGSDDKVSARLLLRENTAGGSVEVNIQSALDKLAEPIADGGAGITFTPTHGGSATVAIAPDELTMQVSISDGMGRSVMSALLHGPRATTDEAGESVSVGGLIDSSCTLHEQLVAVPGDDFGILEAVFQIDSAGNTTQSFSDDLGRQRGSIDQLGKITKRQNGPKGEPRNVFDALSKETRYEYDILGRQRKMFDDSDNFTETKYDFAGRVDRQYDRKRNFTTTEYDDLGRVWRTKDRAGFWTTRSYDAAGRLKTLTDAETRVTTYDYDILGRRTLTALEDGSAKLMKYDAAGRVIEMEMASGKKYKTTYGFAGQIEKKDYFDSTGAAAGSDTFTYDAFLRPTGSTSADGVTTVKTYTNRGQLRTEATTYGEPTDPTYTVTYDYDSRGRLKEILYPSGKKAEYTYEERSLLGTIKWANSQISDRGYDENGLLTSIDRPQVDETRTYNNLNLLTQINNPGAVKADYTYDANRNKLSETFSGDSNGVMASKSFTTQAGSDDGYDAEDRFMRFNQTGNNALFTRSNIGNISNVNLNNSNIARGYSNVHELETLGTSTQIFDVDGNLATMASGTTLGWDEAGRLDSASTNNPSGFAGTVNYGYSGEGTRVIKQASPTGGTASTTVYIYSGPNCIAEYTSGQAATSPEVEFVYSQGIDSLVLVDTGTDRLAVLRNQQWSVTALVNNATSSVEERYAYDHFGKRTILAGNGTTERAISSHKNPYGYTSRRHEGETGLMYYRARYYDPATGEFISRDPMGYVDGMSLYGGYFVPRGVDPFGLSLWVVTNPFVHHYLWGDGSHWDLNSTGWIPRVKARFSNLTSRVKSQLIQDAKNDLGRCRNETESFSNQISGEDSIAYSTSNLFGNHLGMLGRGNLYYSYSCSALRECKNCPCSEFDLGGRNKSRTRISCSVTFEVRDEFTNPADINDANDRSDIEAKNDCYERCEDAYNDDPSWLFRGRRRQDCRTECNVRYIRTDIERYPLTDTGLWDEAWGLGDGSEFTGGNPFSIGGTWTESESSDEGSTNCNPF